jgi:hypothetical protein
LCTGPINVTTFIARAQASASSAPAAATTSAAAVSEVAKKIPLASVAFKKGSSTHVYRIETTAYEKYSVVFSESRKPDQRISISKSEATRLKAEFTDIFWNVKYRTPASQKTCTQYATMTLLEDKTRICLEQKSDAAKTQALLTKLRSRFH